MIGREQAPFLGLALLCGGLATGLAVELAVPSGAGSATALPAAAALPPLPPIPAFVTPVITELAARPLFSASRRPAPVLPLPATVPEAAAPAPPPPPPPPPVTELTLIGVIDSAGARLAVIRIQGVAAPVRVTEGGTVDHWQVARIAADHVVLSAGGSEQELHFPAPRQGQSTQRPRPGGMTSAGPRP